MHKPQEVQVRSLGQEGLLEEGTVAHSSILTWRIPMDREARRATVHRVIKSRTWLKRLSMHAKVLSGENSLGIWKRVKRGAKNAFTALWLENTNFGWFRLGISPPNPGQKQHVSSYNHLILRTPWAYLEIHVCKAYCLSHPLVFV